MWSYLDNTLLPRTFATVDGATFNREHYLLGRVRVRQVRQIKQSSKNNFKRKDCRETYTSAFISRKSYNKIYQSVNFIIKFTLLVVLEAI